MSGGETFIVNGKEYDAYDAVCRVVAAELGNGSYEAIKAQAVATYTLLSRNNVTGAYLTTPSSTVKQAVAEVWGEALYVGSRKMTQIFYFAISNGRTQGPEDVWGGSVAGYGSVDSSWDANVTSAYERTVRMSKEKVISRCQEYLGIDLTDVPVEDWFTVESYTEGGYNGEMTVGGYSKVQKSGSSAFRTGAKITGRILRESVLNLRSACFTWEEDGDDILFTTRGYGHGVGMSQWGAIEMSKMGYDYVEILEHYYPGATVK
ncbi:MAG: SpoIID/LytB domain-containing protein [Oscillospiraceae bacterium]|nr:SpoIID/LytB domain-containing protein [Oscillospiraceae bacterium]